MHSRYNLQNDRPSNISLPGSLLFILLLISFDVFASPIMAKSNLISELRPVCAEEFEATDINEDEITVSLDVNQPGPCDWHKGAPNFGGYDFFSQNYLRLKSDHSISSPLEIKFRIRGLDTIERFNFLELQQGTSKNCKKSGKPFFRLGRWDDAYFLSSVQKSGKDKFTEFNISKEVSPTRVTEFELKIEKREKSLELSVYANEISLFTAQAYAEECDQINVSFGARSFGKKNAGTRIGVLSFIDLTIVGSTAKGSPDEISLNHAYTLTNDNLALCNDGTEAGFFSTHSLDRDAGKKVLIAFEGGGAALSASSDQTKYAEAYDKRPDSLMTSPLSQGKKRKKLSGYFKNAADDGWTLIYLPYCSSDLYMGDHRLELDGEKFEVRGRRIVKALTEYLLEKKVINKGTDLLLVGGSAGDVAISANLDIFEMLPKKRMRLLFTMWQVPSERRFLEKKQASQFNKLVPNAHLKFTHGNLADHCKGSIAACTPNLENISRFEFDDIFVEGHWKELPGETFAFTPRHMTNHEMFEMEMTNAILEAGGGFTLLGKKVWRPNKSSNHTIGNLQVEIGEEPVVPSRIVWNWISGKEPTKYIGR